jgi:uncharacterized protein (TIGR00369 family)
LEDDMPIDAKQLEKFLNHGVPFNRYLGIVVGDIEEGVVRLDLPYREEFIGDPRRPALHGGLLSTLIDACGGAAVWSATEQEDRISTVDLRVDFLRPVPPEDIFCVARCVRKGNMVGVAEMNTFAVSAPERILATGRGVYNIVRPSGARTPASG